MKLVLFVIMLLSATMAQANRFPAEPACFKPNKPLFFSPQSYTLRYQQDVVEYKDCIQRFIQEQRQAMKLHQESIRHAEQLMKLYIE